ncbi:GlxA family transcriptional regulator [Streptomyces camelliae]
MVIAAYDDAELLEISCVTSVLDTANRQGASPPYEARLATPEGRPVRCASGLVLASQAALEKIRGPADSLIIVGGRGHRAAAGNARFVEHVRRLAKVSRRVASVCTGASVLAEAGLLDGRRATTHWSIAGELAARHPEIDVDPAPLYIRDGRISTAAGVTSALDLTLAFVEEDHGPALARSVARMMVTYLQRPGNQAQISMFVAAPVPGHRTVQQVVEHITAALDHDLGVPALAERAGVSERHLTRLFLDHLGQTPARFVRTARTEAASHLLVSSELPLSAVARRCGFRSTETLRQAFLDRYGTTPSQHRAIHGSTS